MKNRLSKVSQSKLYQPDIDDFEFQDKSIATEVVRNRYVDFDIFRQKIAAGKIVKDKIRISEVDMPLLFNETEEGTVSENQQENYARVRDMVQRALNGERRGDHDTVRESDFWVKRPLEDIESRRYIQSMFLKALYFLEKNLTGSVSQSLKNQIQDMHRSPQAIIKFVSLAHANRNNKKNGAMVCALCNIADAFHYMNNESSLQDLREKTIEFSDFLAQSMGSDFEKGDDLENFSENYPDISIPVHMGNTSFLIHNISFDTKSENRIVAKLLRVVDKGASEIVKDGIRARIFANDYNKQKVLEWLKSLGFVDKNSDTMTKGESFQTIIYMVGTFKGSHVEIQITDENTLNDAEKGIYRHEVYEDIQRLLLLSRLFGAVSNVRVQEVAKDLKKRFNIDEKQFIKRVEQFLFKHPQNDHWYSYEYEFRTFDKGIYPLERFDQVIQSFQRDFWNIPQYKILNELSSKQLKDILTTYKFSEDISSEILQTLIDYLSSKKGIPRGILKALEVQKAQKDIRLKDSVQMQSQLREIFQSHGILISLDLWKDIYRSICPEIQRKLRDDSYFWEYIGYLAEELNKQKIWINSSSFEVPLEKMRNQFIIEQTEYIRLWILDPYVQTLLIYFLEKIIDDLIAQPKESV